MQLLLSFVSLLGEARPQQRFVVPVAATREVDRIARAHGAEVVRSQMSIAAILESAGGGDVDFAASLDAGYAFPRFLPAFDGTVAAVKLLEALASTGRRLSEVVDALPVAHLVEDMVVTPWEQKGAVMRSLIEQSAGKDVELIDGVKVQHPTGWVMALPDTEEPITRVWAEGDDPAAARALCDEYSRRIRAMVGAGGDGRS